jgi:hypothetical protein
MQPKRLLMALACLFVWLAADGQVCTARRGISLPFKVKADTTACSAVPGAVTLRLYVSPNLDFKCDEITLTVTKIDNLIYDGPMSLVSGTNKSGLAVFELPIIIPGNDTAGLDFNVLRGKLGQFDQCYWVTTDDTVKFYRGNPRKYPSARLAGKKQKIDSTFVWQKAEALKWPHGRMSKHDKDGNLIWREGEGWFDKDGNIISEEEFLRQREESKKANPLFVPGDSSVVWFMSDSGLYPVKKSDLPTKRDRDLEQMRKLEETPLTEYDRQDFFLDGEHWTRGRGESKFQPARGFTHEERWRMSDSLRAITDTTTFVVTLDLRDPKDYEIARDLVGNLEPMEIEGYYKASATGLMLKQLRVRGINDARYPQIPPDRKIPLNMERKTPPPKKPKSSIEETANPDGTGIVTLFSDDFEDHWSG